MTDNVAWLFPGQGSQEVGMGGDLLDAHPVARETLEEADDRLGFALSRLMIEGPKEELDDTINTQPALYVHSVALARVGVEEGILQQPRFGAGHSLGEYSALTAAGALPFDEGLRLVRERGRLMKLAGTRAPGGMAAIIALDDETVAQLCASASEAGETVQVANYNCPGQVVISGAEAAVVRAMDAARDAGARKVVRLDISIAAHSPLMESVLREFEEAVAATTFQNPAFPIISNVTALPLRTPDAIREDLVAQLTGSVRWTDSIRFLLDQEVTAFIEIGAGNVLTGLVKRIDRKVERINVSSREDLQALQAQA